MWNTVKSYHEFPISLCFFFHVNSSNSFWLVRWKMGWEAEAFKCRSSGDKMCSKQEKKQINMFPRCFKTQVSPTKSNKNYENSIQNYLKKTPKWVKGLEFPVNHIGSSPGGIGHRPSWSELRWCSTGFGFGLSISTADGWLMVGIPHAGWPLISRGNG